MGGERARKEDDVQVGDEMDDGTIYAGFSPDTGKAMYATPVDAPLTYTFNEAADYARQLNAQKFLGHDDWRVPSQGELNVLFNHVAVTDRRKQHDTGIRGWVAALLVDSSRWYWSASRSVVFGVTVQDFNSGRKGNIPKDGFAHLRCVR
jgi:hypothetical protein